ncbi:MAG: UvrD-helicase domain-containing protein [Cytophagales bacterium]|nr:UvrD-helicase domain-containing protein [Bernardetiaceae bacterium]MDW8204104.1 UvrD-helicase domain-containing protein [Cytophagales bacterium]
MSQFKVYRSSAGSGKTYTLTKQFIKLALVGTGGGDFFKGDYYRHILAITFTKDAAKEMKERIIAALRQISELKEGETTPLLNEITDEITREYPHYTWTTEKLRNRAATTFTHLLHHYSDLSISTIDSFNNRVVQSFTKDLDLPYHYEIALESDELLETAVGRLMERVGKSGNSELTRLLQDFARQEAEEGRRWRIDSALMDFGEHLFKEESRGIVALLAQIPLEQFADMRRELQHFRAVFENRVVAIAQSFLSLLQQNGLAPNMLAGGSRGIGLYFSKLAAGDFAPLTEGPSNTIINNVREGTWTAGKLKESEQRAIQNIAHQLADIFYQLEDWRVQHIGTYIETKLALRCICQLAALGELRREVDQLMIERNQVHISEFNYRINRIIESEPVPYLYERIGERYHHLLIDEFQDTSQMQWHNLIPLIANALGKQYTNMLVGDAKQAIYRWRGGNAELMVQLPAVPTAQPDSPIANEIGIFRQYYQLQTLQYNFRSVASIVAFNNELFQWIVTYFGETYPELLRYYAQSAQTAHKQGAGQVELQLIGKQNAISDTNYAENTFQACREIIDRAQADGFRLGEIAIICRTNQAAIGLASRLVEAGYRVVSPESLLLTNSARVRFIIGFMQIMVQPLNPIVKSEVLYFLYKHLKIDGLNGEYASQTHREIAEQAKKPRISEFLQFIREKFDKKLVFRALQYLSLYEIGEELIRIFHLNDDVYEQIFLQRLLDELLAFGQNKSNNLADFIDHWHKKANKISVSMPPSGDDAIRLMTIHSAKGLQFPVVIVPYTDWKLTPDTKTHIWVPWAHPTLASQLPALWVHAGKQLLHTSFADAYRREEQAIWIDALNILYVALTRAENRLYIIGKLPNKKDTSNINSVNLLLAAFAWHKQIPAHSSTDKERYVFAFEETPPMRKIADPQVKPYAMSTFLSTESRDKLRMRRNDKGQAENRIDIQALYDARKQGLLLHYAFEKVRYASDVPTAVAALLHEGLIDQQEKDALQAKMTALLALPEIAPLFEPLPGRIIFNEKELIAKRQGEKDSKTLRPDRLVIDPHQITILDYKTGMESQQQHAEQVRSYARLIAQMPMYANRPVRALLLYTLENKVVEALPKTLFSPSTLSRKS